VWHKLSLADGFHGCIVNNAHLHSAQGPQQRRKARFRSEANFRKCFRQAMSCAPKPYRQKIRLQAATVLQRSSGLPILNTARFCDYTNLSNFSR